MLKLTYSKTHCDHHNSFEMCLSGEWKVHSLPWKASGKCRPGCGWKFHACALEKTGTLLNETGDSRVIKHSLP